MIFHFAVRSHRAISKQAFGLAAKFFINLHLTGSIYRLMPFFNRSNNADLILAIQSAGVSRGRNGFRKDKSGEKLAESEEDLLEHRTDGSDAFDTLYIGCEKFPYRDTFTLSMPGVL